MKKGWDMKGLGEVFTFRQGIQRGVKLQSEIKAEGQVRFLRIVDYTQGNEPPRFIDNPGEQYLLGKNDISLVRYGASTGFVCRGFEGALANNLFRLIPNSSSNVNYEFLYYFLQSSFFQKHIQKVMNGAAMPAISFGMIKNIMFPLIEIREQKQIVSILDKAFSVIERSRNNIEKNIQNAKELFQSKLNEIFSQKGEGWEEKTLGEVCEKTKNIKWQDHPNQEFKYVDLSSVSRESLIVTETTIVNERNAPSRAKKAINTGDVIFATTRPTLKRATIIDSELDGQICSTGYVVLSPKDDISSDWIFFYLLTSTFMGRMEALQRGASYPAVTDNDVKGSILSVPLYKESEKMNVTRMNELRASTNDLILRYRQKNESLEELKKSILQKAFAGELTDKGVVV